ncbi:MAG: 1-(5-phosphoribosyl)-5-[(5-phosphoribosylamino)methylideneamino] imidazole-4-carboxamide isomerase [Saprospiraceae bacterium]
MLVFPAIDLINGKCVRLAEGDFAQIKEYSADPIDIAKKYEDAGLTHLHVVDLDGARNKKVSQYKILEEIVSKTTLRVDFGGGIQSDDDLKIVFESGAKQANIGSLAVASPEKFEIWLETHGFEKIILAADVRNKMMAAHAWKETSSMHLNDLVDRFLLKGLKYLTCTDISKDGMLQGANQDLYFELSIKYPSLCITASGGVHQIEDLQKLKEINSYGVIVGKAIYENKVSLQDLYFIQNN